MYLENIVKRSMHVKVNPSYGIGIKNVSEIREAFKDDPTEMILATFRIGYLQGQTAQRENENEELMLAAFKFGYLQGQTAQRENEEK